MLPKVIFVDDSELILEAAKEGVLPFSIDLRTFSGADEAYEDLNNGEVPKLIITDLNMPGMNGYEFLDKIRENSSTKNVPILMVTDKPSDQMKAYCKKRGLTGWIHKPFSNHDLQMALKRVMRF